MVKSGGPIRFLIPWCPAKDIIDCILLPWGTIPNVCWEMTFNFILKLPGAFVFSLVDASKALFGSCNLSNSILSLVFFQFLNHSFLLNPVQSIPCCCFLIDCKGLSRRLGFRFNCSLLQPATSSWLVLEAFLPSELPPHSSDMPC